MSTHVDELAFAPKRHFDRPEDVIEDKKLTAGDKLRILESWKQDAQRLADCTAENMNGDEDTDLSEVSRVLVRLKTMTVIPEAFQENQTTRVVSGMTIGALLGAAVGLVATAATSASLVRVAQTTVAGLIIGGAAKALRKPPS